MSASFLLSLLIACFLASLGLFWILFLTVVLAKISADDVAREESKLEHRFSRWPLAELAAYEKHLTQPLRRKWYNWYILNASKVAGWLLAAVVIVAMVTWCGPYQFIHAEAASRLA